LLLTGGKRSAWYDSGMSDEPVGKQAYGLTGLGAGPLARVPVRRRDSDYTLSAWRLEVTCDQGSGAIVLVEISPAESRYRGDGVFLGWPQDRLAEVYRDLTQPSGDPGPSFELMQLG